MHTYMDNCLAPAVAAEAAWMCMYIYIHIYNGIYEYTQIHISVYIHVYVYIYIYIYVCMYIHLSGGSSSGSSSMNACLRGGLTKLAKGFKRAQRRQTHWIFGLESQFRSHVTAVAAKMRFKKTIAMEISILNDCSRSHSKSLI